MPLQFAFNLGNCYILVNKILQDVKMELLKSALTAQVRCHVKRSDGGNGIKDQLFSWMSNTEKKEE